MRKINILIIAEDEQLIQDTYSAYDSPEYDIFPVNSGKEALDTFAAGKTDLVILDLTMPRIDAWQICRTIHASSSVPIIAVTDSSLEEDEMIGFEPGVDEYLNKPINAKRLVSRTVSLLNREQKMKVKNPAYIEINALTINSDYHEVYLHNRRLNLSPREYELLYFLASNRGQLLSREQILHGVWGYDYYGDLRTVDTHVWRLREKLREAANMIKTERGRGYRLETLRRSN